MHSRVSSFPPLRTKWLGQDSTTELIIQFILESTFLVFIGSKLLSFFFYKSIKKDSFNISLWMNQLVLMLYYTVFYEMTPRPYISYWNFISLIFFFSLSLILPFIYTFLLYFALNLELKFNSKKKIWVATKIWPI